MYPIFSIDLMLKIAKRYNKAWLNDFDKVIENDDSEVYIPIWYVSGNRQTDLNTIDFNRIIDGTNTLLMRQLKSLGEKKIKNYYRLNRVLPKGKRYKAFEIVFNVDEIFN